MLIKENVLLAPYTTFKIGGEAKWFCEVKDQQEALEAFEFARESNLAVFVLGGGSNVLVSDKGFDGLVIRVINRGIEVIDEINNLSPALPSSISAKATTDRKGEGVLLKVASGEVWDEVVSFAVKNGWWGIENLSHIPGSTGAIAVQNVGAYGQEAKNVIETVTVFKRETRQILSLTNQDCGFAYRTSIFNTSDKGKYIIFYIILRLQKNGQPNLSYRDLAVRFEGKNPSLEEVRQAVIEIRDRKFPFPTEPKKGNAGSFFKNPVLDKKSFNELKSCLPDIFQELEKRAFREEGRIKVPAAFLIELCGLKDMQSGGAAINQSQPLIIINKTGKATAEEVLGMAKHVRETVKNKLGIVLDFEPELVGF